MGKKGDLLRKLKKQKATYTFTGEELEARDRDIYRKARESMLPELKQKVLEYEKQSLKEQHADLDAYWKEKHAQFKEGGTESTMANTMAYTMALCCRVLIEQFGWKPPGPRGRNPKIIKLAEALLEKVGYIRRSSETDLVKYYEETKELYGIEFPIITSEDVPEEAKEMPG